LQHTFQTDKTHVGDRPMFHQIMMSCQQHQNNKYVTGLNISLNFLKL